MAYTNQAAILGQIQLSDLIALTDDSGAEVVDTSILDTVIAAADDTIDAAIGNIYQVPISPVVAPITSWSLTITCYMLYRRRLVPDEKNIFTESYNRVVKLLDLVNDGQYRLNLQEVRDFSQVAIAAQGTIYGTVGSNMPSTSM